MRGFQSKVCMGRLALHHSLQSPHVFRLGEAILALPFTFLGKLCSLKAIKISLTLKTIISFYQNPKEMACHAIPTCSCETIMSYCKGTRWLQKWPP